MIKKMAAFVVSICLMISAFGATAFAAKQTASTLVPGLWNSFLIDSDGSLWGWGANGGSEGYTFLGDGTTTTRSVPVKITGNVKTVIPGYECALVIKKDNSLWGFGKAVPGLIEPVGSQFQLSPKKIMDNVAAAAISDGLETPDKIGVLILKTDGTLWTAGYDGVKTLPAPQQIMTGVKDVFAGLGNFYAIKKDGALMAWGDAYDRLGKEQATDKAVPVKVMDNAENCAIGAYSTYAVKKDGTLWGFGYNMFGILGDVEMVDLSQLSNLAEDGGYQSMLDMNQLVGEPVMVAEGAAPQISESANVLYFMKADNSLWAISYESTFDSITEKEIYSRTMDEIMTNVDYFSAGLSSHMFIVQKDGSTWFVDPQDNGFTQSGDGTADRKFNPVAMANAKGLEGISYTVLKAMISLGLDDTLMPINRDNFLRYAEQGIASYAETSAKTVDKSTVEGQKSEAETIKGLLENQIALSGPEYFRKLESGVTVDLGAETVVNIDSSVVEADVDSINILGHNFGLLLEPKKMGEDLSDGLQVSVTASGSGKFKVDLSKDLSRPLKVQVSAWDGMPPARLYVADAKGNPVPSLYNSANGKLEFKVVSSGEYSVEKNLTSYGDLGSDPGVSLAVYHLALKGIMPGTGKDTFSPDEPISRAEAAALIAKALGGYNAEAEASFKDAGKGSEFYAGIGSAEKMGIIKDSDSGDFRPNDTLKKYEAAVMCESALLYEYDYAPTEDPALYIGAYSDADLIPEWSKEYVAMAVRDGIFGVLPEEAFNPDAALTRGEFSKLLNRLYKLSW